MSKARDLANAGTALTTVSATELGYLDGVTSAVQTQIDSKIGSASAINPTIVDAKGDIIAASAADTVARLAVGANNTVLTADSSTATGLKWATPSAGWTLISTATLSGSTGISFTSIPTTYSQLRIICSDIYVNTATSAQWMYMRFNNDSTADNYVDTGWVQQAGGFATSRVTNDAHGKNAQLAPIQPPTQSTSVANEPYRSFSIIEILNPSDTTRAKMTRWTSMGNESQGTVTAMGRYKGTSAISQIDFIRNGTSTYTGNVYLYGI
jgi:hypothetical protein